MRKLNPDQHAKDLKRKNGLDVALKIAQRCVNGTASVNHSSIPNSVCFSSKDKRGGVNLDVAHLMRLNNFWTHVLNVLKKTKN